MARPTKMNKEVRRLIEICAKKGFTDVELADLVGVTEKTLNNWKHNFPDFFDDLKSSKAEADAEIEKCLFNKAKGFNATEIKTIYNKDGDEMQTITTEKIMPPDSVACIFWLKNRQPANWRDKIEHGGDLNLNIVRKEYKPSKS